MKKNPVIILVRPQLSENVGAVVRAMGNFSLEKLRVVSPLANIIDKNAIAMAAGNEDVLHKAQHFNSLEDAIFDCQFVLGTSARSRTMEKDKIPPLFDDIDPTLSTAIVFGPERTGLHNDEVALCHKLISIPVNPNFSSINLAQSSVIIFYEWFKLMNTKKNAIQDEKTVSPALLDKRSYFLKSLENILDDINFWRVKDKKQTMWINIQNTFTRHLYTDQELQTLTGVIKDIHTHIKK